MPVKVSGLLPRRTRVTPAGLACHVMNRAATRAAIFEGDGDYAAFEWALAEAPARCRAVRLLAYCLMPNHWHLAPGTWHLVPWPAAGGVLSPFMRWLTMTHTQRRHAHRHTAGSGQRAPVPGSRFRHFPVQADAPLLNVCRYVERNALREDQTGHS